MTFDRRHIHVQWGGTLPGGEIWSNSLRMGGSGVGENAYVPTHADLETWVHGNMKTVISAWHSNVACKVSNSAKLTFLKANVTDMAGHYTDPTTIEHVYSPVVSGGVSSNPHPTQVALVVALTTDVSRGWAHRGRFYMPMPCQLVDATNGLISAADAIQVATAAATFIHDLADEPGLDLGVFDQRVLVMSQRGTGATHVVTGVDVGRVLDTQQRRRNALPETYQHVAVNQDA